MAKFETSCSGPTANEVCFEQNSRRLFVLYHTGKPVGFRFIEQGRHLIIRRLEGHVIPKAWRKSYSGCEYQLQDDFTYRLHLAFRQVIMP